MKCTLVKSELGEDNYVLTIRRQDGSELQVLIPREDSAATYERDCIKPGQVFGLNFVTEGHYT